VLFSTRLKLGQLLLAVKGMSLGTVPGKAAQILKVATRVSPTLSSTGRKLELTTAF